MSDEFDSLFEISDDVVIEESFYSLFERILFPEIREKLTRCDFDFGTPFLNSIHEALNSKSCDLLNLNSNETDFSQLQPLLPKIVENPFGLKTLLTIVKIVNSSNLTNLVKDYFFTLYDYAIENLENFFATETLLKRLHFCCCYTLMGLNENCYRTFLPETLRDSKKFSEWRLLALELNSFHFIGDPSNGVSLITNLPAMLSDRIYDIACKLIRSPPTNLVELELGLRYLSSNGFYFDSESTLVYYLACYLNIDVPRSLSYGLMVGLLSRWGSIGALCARLLSRLTGDFTLTMVRKEPASLRALFYGEEWGSFKMFQANSYLLRGEPNLIREALSDSFLPLSSIELLLESLGPEPPNLIEGLLPSLNNRYVHLSNYAKSKVINLFHHFDMVGRRRTWPICRELENSLK